MPKTASHGKHPQPDLREGGTPPQPHLIVYLTSHRTTTQELFLQRWQQHVCSRHGLLRHLLSLGRRHSNSWQGSREFGPLQRQSRLRVRLMQCSSHMESKAQSRSCVFGLFVSVVLCTHRCPGCPGCPGHFGDPPARVGDRARPPQADLERCRRKSKRLAFRLSIPSRRRSQQR